MAEEGDNPVPASEVQENMEEEGNSAEGVPMESETPQKATKRAREEDPQNAEEEDNNGDDLSKKQRLEVPGGSQQQNGAEKSVEEVRLDGLGAQEEEEAGDGDADAEEDGVSRKEDEEEDGVSRKEDEEEEDGDGEDGGGVVADDGKANEEEEKKGPVKLGPKFFNTSKEMFDYFYKFLHNWPLNINVNKYEHMVLSELLIRGHHESDKKVGPGVEAFQIRVHPVFNSRCYFLIRKDDSIDDFSYRKCVDSLLPLPENMQVSGKSNFARHDPKNSKQSKQGRGSWGGGKGGGGRGGGRGGRHGGRGRHGGWGRGHGRS